MEARLFLQCKSHFSTPAHRRSVRPAKYPPPILSVLTRPADHVKKESDSKTVHNDNWFDLIAINHLSRSVQATTGVSNSKSGYKSLVEAATVASQSFNPIQQREVVIKALNKAFPRPILTMIRTLLPNSKFAREYFAVFTTIFFKWLVGPCEVRESELDGRRERNVVHIKKCRFLEESNCVGMCINLCKMPSQTFIKDSLGMPINMVPSRANQKHTTNCSSEQKWSIS
ncbi:beta-carotene isomerase D27, chloroplastic isoform X2 [Diospyros lotus]|uniref:beta-carotene isomerase D27, chloroplastic isoform X2 n=1 Tax=Diospyros lotus TaxID=55363 RepID=UPI00225667AF|nr:beta-carotene isomerase D27, chloroplastic isoform X2 [Diospyros lotus]